MLSEQYLHIEETESTNNLMKAKLRKEALAEGFIIYTDFQTHGKGQSTNKWESAKGKNLLFSLLIKPLHIAIQEQFIISQLCSNGIIYVLRTLIPAEASNFSIKWPNDIYWKDKKLGGILIENSLQGSKIINSILGVGLNINQTEFTSDAPNPVSLKQITRKEYDRAAILHQLIKKIAELYAETNHALIHQDYMLNLYRKEGYHTYQADGKTFKARIQTIHSDGQLILEDEEGVERGFYFKEVAYLI